MPVKFTGPVPPDQPMFTIGPSFVFRSEPPPAVEEADVEHEDDRADEVPNTE